MTESQSFTIKDAPRTQYTHDELLAMTSDQLRTIIKDGLIDVETEDFISKELYIRDERFIYPEPEGDPSY